MKIAVTGGHHTPAFALLAELAKDQQLEVTWFGHRFSMRGDQSESVEFRAVTEKGFRFIDLKAGKFYRTYNPFELGKIPLGFFQAFIVLLKKRPEIIISFGGYLAPPVALAGFFLGIPVVTHEQTLSMGLANKFVSRLARRVYLSWPSENLQGGKYLVSGNPLRQDIFRVDSNYRQEILRRLGGSGTTILVMGGKQGAHVINQVILESQKELLKSFNIIHQTGDSALFQDQELLSQAVSHLPMEFKKRYYHAPYFDERAIGTLYSLADIVICRAGANTVYELAALKKVAILIPIPWASGDEQQKQAKFLEEAGSAVILSQEELEKDLLMETIRKVQKNYSQMLSGAEVARKRILLNAEELIVQDLKKTFPKTFHSRT